MKNITLLISLLTIVSNCFSQLSLTEIIAKAEKAVCYIETYDENGNILKMGTGFIIDENGTCVSNYHVFENSKDVKVTTINKQVYTVNEIIKSSKEHDIIVFTINSTNSLNYLTINDSIPLKGENVITIGNPIGLSWSASEGIIASVRKSELGNFLQITAPISQGNSGSPILNSNGEVIGVATFLITEGQNLNFGLHIGVLDSIISNIAIIENLNQKAILPSNCEIAKMHIDSLLKIGIPGEYELGYINEFIKKYPDLAFGHIKKGDYHLRRYEWEYAYNAYSKAIVKEPENPEGYRSRAGLILRFGFNEELKGKALTAISDSKKFGTFSQDFLLLSYSWIASFYEELGETKNAISYYTKYINENIKKGNKDISSAYISRAYLYWKNEDFSNANEDFDSAIELSPTCHNIRWKVSFLIEYEKYEEASRILSDGCLSTYGDYYNKSLILYEINGDLVKAEKYLQTGMSILKGYIEQNISTKEKLFDFYWLSAMINESNEDYIEILKALNNMCDINPSLNTDYSMSFWKLETKYSMKDYIGGLKDVNLLIEKFPEKVDLHTKKGLFLYMLGDNFGAIKAFDKAISLDKDDGYLYRMRGISKYYNDDKSNACIDLSKAGELGDYKAYELIKKYCN